jgi:ADP-ribose pyrophosphatase YjhB (NUDIX family)
MYKIFINEYPLVITSDDQDFFGGGNYRMLDDSESSIGSAIKTLENSEKMTVPFGLMIIAEDAEQTFKQLTKRYKKITAAGGIVYNAKGELLLIKRQGKWDLPKGKKDKGENEEQAALREVKEECGIEQLELGELIVRSYHTYHQEGQRVLKTTYWYKMKAISYKNLSPQLEENITELAWVVPASLDLENINTYNSIRDVLKKTFDGCKAGYPDNNAAQEKI